MKDKIKTLYDYFEVNGDKKTVLKDSTPENVVDSFRDNIHGVEMLPNDTRFDMIVESLEMILNYDFENKGELIDFEHEINDSLVDIYNHDLTRWLDSHSLRQEYCNEAMELFGCSADIVQIIKGGQYQEYQEIFNGIIKHCEIIDE